MNNDRIPVGILGATGMVGQEFVSFLRDHPWFDLTWLGASDRSAGKPYREATSWRLGGIVPLHVPWLANPTALGESKRLPTCLLSLESEKGITSYILPYPGMRLRLL